jgi:hypothetical protein
MAVFVSLIRDRLPHALIVRRGRGTRAAGTFNCIPTRRGAKALSSWTSASNLTYAYPSSRALPTYCLRLHINYDNKVASALLHTGNENS